MSAASLRQRTGAHSGGRGNSNRQHVAAAVCIGNVLEDLGEAKLIAVGHTNGFPKGIGGVSTHHARCDMCCRLSDPP